MSDITFQVDFDEQTGFYAASWNAPDGSGGISTQGESLTDLQQQVLEAVDVHFEEGEAPAKVRLHFVSDPVLASARNFPEVCLERS